MKILATSPTTLNDRHRVFIGLETDMDIISANTRINFSRVAVADFRKKISIRAIYKMFSATWSHFDDTLHMLATIFTNCIKKSQFQEYREKYDAAIKNYRKQWQTLDLVVKALKNELDTAASKNTYAFASKQGFHGVAEVAGSSLSDSNVQIKENVERRLQALYGDNQFDL